MRRIFLSLSVMLLLAFIYFAVMNFDNSVNINYLFSPLLDAQTKAGWTDQGAYFNKALSLGIYTLATLFAGVFVGAGIVYMFLSAQNEKVKAYQRELEKTSVTGMNSASRVEVLEAKIKTLEKAFNTVADERTQLEVQIKNLNQEIDNISKNK
ncbi:hypothetical protein IJ472_06240 [bacterium]|nr:hypothetical protein [bacterium]